MKYLTIYFPETYEPGTSKPQVLNALRTIYGLSIDETVKIMNEFQGRSGHYCGAIDTGYEKDYIKKMVDILSKAGFGYAHESGLFDNVDDEDCGPLQDQLKNLLVMAIELDEMELAYDLFLTYKNNFGQG